MAARSLNKVLIIGNLTRDPELRYTANGTPIATFGVATNREYIPTGNNEKVEETEFHNIVAWSKLAELCGQLLAKGQKVYIEGRMHTRNWVDEQSSKKLYRTEIIAEEMIVLSPSSKGGYQQGEIQGGNEPVNSDQSATIQTGGLKESGDTKAEEIPF